MTTTSRFTAWLQLLRLPNIFTAIADVTMGYLIARRELDPPLYFGLLVGVSCLLYLSGMILNDMFDAEVDAVEQPGRPIPSGRISRGAAAILGWTLLCSGIALGWILTFSANDWRPGVIATMLAAIILLYDGWLKHSRFGPLLMGECRFLNVLLGMSLMILPWGKAELLIATGLGVYVMGVTKFARTDAHVSSRTQLTSGFLVILAGLALLTGTPWLSYFRPPLEVPTGGWYLLWTALFLITGRRCVVAILDPSPQRVQAAVRHCVQSIIILDAAVCAGYVGSYWGFVIISFLIPTFALTFWLRAT